MRIGRAEMLTIRTMKGAAWLVMSRFIGRFLDFFTLLVMARLLSPADFGLFAIAMILISIVDIVLEVPIVQSLIRLPEITQSHLDTCFTLGLLRGALLFVVVASAAYPFALIYHAEHLTPVILTLALGCLIKGIYSPAMAAHFRELNFARSFWAEFSGKVVAASLAIGIASWGGHYWSLVANFFAAGVVTTIMSYVLAPYRPRLSVARFPELSGFFGWFSVAQILSALNWQFDRILLGTSLDRAMLGRFTMASDLATMPTQSLVGPALQPVMAAFSKLNTEPDRLQRAFLKAGRIAMLISAPVCIGIALTADMVVAIVLGPSWDQAAPILRVLALTVLMVPYFQTLYALALSINRPQSIAEINAVEFASRVILVTTAFLLYSLDGVLAARILIAMGLFAIYLVYARSLTGVSIVSQLANLWQIALSALLMACVVTIEMHVANALPLPIIIKFMMAAATGAGTYAICLYAFGLRPHVFART